MAWEATVLLLPLFMLNQSICKIRITMTDFRTRLIQVPVLAGLAALVILIAFALRFFALDQFPPDVQHNKVCVAKSPKPFCRDNTLFSLN